MLGGAPRRVEGRRDRRQVEAELEFVSMPQYTLNSADLMLSLRADLASAVATTVALPRAWVAVNHSATAATHLDVGGGTLGVRVRVRRSRFPCPQGPVSSSAGGEQQSITNPQVARGWVRPPCRHFKT